MDYLAIDFGDGTTTVAHYNTSFRGTEPECLNILRGTPEIWSCIGYDQKGENPVIGESAPQMPNYTLYQNWKSYPSEYKKTEKGKAARKIAIAFMKQVFLSFLAQNPNYDIQGTYNGTSCKIVIGVPCDWNKEDIEEYRKMATEAGIPKVEVIKESQAAMFFARRFMKTKKGSRILDEEIRCGVLLIDVGSSTTDFTFMKGADIVHHCGLPLGAKYVETMFLTEGMHREKKRYWPRPEDPTGITYISNAQKGPSNYVQDLMTVRRFKEDFFRNADINPVNPCQMAYPLPASGIRTGQDGFITPQFVHKCLNGNGNSVYTFPLKGLSEEWSGCGMDRNNSWRGHFRKSLEHVKRKWGINKKTTIVVTGGATRMQFVEDDIKNVLGCDNLFFGDDGARSFSVVKGLAWAAYARDEIQKAKDSMEVFFQKEDNREKINIDQFVDDLLEKPAEKIAGNVKGNLCNLLEHHDKSVSSLKKISDKYSELMCQEWNDLIGRLNEGFSIKSFLDKPILSGLTDPIYEEFGRAEIKVSTDVNASFQYTMNKIEIPFNPLKHIFWEPDWEEDFNACILDKFGPAKNACWRTITPFFVLQELKGSLTKSGTGESIPSIFQSLCEVVFNKVRDFKLAELDAILGAFEYDRYR